VNVSNSGPRPDQVSRVLDFLRRYAAGNLQSRLADERRCLPPSVVLDLGAEGVLGLQAPEEYGGLGLSYADALRVMAQTAAMDPSLSLLVLVQNAVGIPPIERFASERLRAQALPRLARGAALATIAASEPGAGSNVRGITTRATRLPGGGYRLDGGKAWISLGSWARYLNVFALLQDEAGRPLGITGFLVESDRAGFIAGHEAMTLGMKGIPQN
jgi:alkylation response protein AidB-like acyl-CoA dehydrogenase